MTTERDIRDVRMNEVDQVIYPDDAMDIIAFMALMVERGTPVAIIEGDGCRLVWPAFELDDDFAVPIGAGDNVAEALCDAMENYDKWLLMRALKLRRPTDEELDIIKEIAKKHRLEDQAKEVLHRLGKTALETTAETW